MSTNGINLSFESFLQKRKDTMKMWVTYWFRLQNTTLFFYTKKNGSASHLRGSYYVYNVQSVREVKRVDTKRFMFEIVMANGKRKLLAAETAALRQQWIEHLWQAMQLSNSRGTFLPVSEQRKRADSFPSDAVEESPSPKAPLSAPTGHILPEASSTSSPSSPSEEPNSQGDRSLQSTDRLRNANKDEFDYDILPARKNDQTDHMDEDAYDFPMSSRRAAEPPDLTEDIYAVPRNLMMQHDRSSAFSSEEQQEDRLHQTDGPV
ncbi:uncharacterized protein [Antennarius striatus]|uniref:uncharacterized protein isoform X1 n=1 Tax=Antennarius striatus TaxID=241820 RepID=UPI0035AE6EFD